MKLTMYYKDSIRKLKTSIFRYISIIVIIMLGVGFFVGMNSVAPDMKKTTEEYLKTSNVFDIQLTSNLGYDKEDIEKFKQIEEVTDVEPVYNYDVLTTKNDKNLPIRIVSKPKEQTINKNDIIMGKDVQFQNECLIDTRLHSIYNLNIGDTIKIYKNDEDLSKVISKTEYTIVGITRNPTYLSAFYGSTELENGELVGYITVLEDNIKLEKYTSIYIKTNIDNNLDKTSEEYKNKLDDISSKIEEVQNTIVDEKYKKVYDEYSKDIEKAQNELNTKKNEIKTAKETIENSQKQINNAVLSVAQGVSNVYQSPQIYERFQTKKAKLDELYTSYDTSSAEKNTIEAEYEKLQEEVENKQIELSKLNNNINNEIYEMHLLGNENPKYVEQTRKANELDYSYNVKKQELTVIEEKYKKLEKDLADKKQSLKTLKEQIDKEQENFYNNFLSTEDIMLGSGNQEISQSVQEIKKNQEALNTSKQNFEKENYDTKIDEAKQELSESKKELKNFEKLSLVTKLYESGGFKSLDNDLEKIAIMGRVFPVMFFIVAALVTITTITRMIEEDRTNIGVLKALGYSKQTIMKRYIIYSLSATIIGVIIGTLLGSTLIAQVLFAAYGSLYILPDLIIEINLMYTSLAAIISIFATVGVTFIIAKKELKEKPANLLRPKPVKEGKNIFLEKIPVFWGKLSFLFKICFRNIFRYKRRLFMTLIGIAGCTMLVYTGISLNDTVNNIASRQFAEIRTYQMEINLTSGITQNEVANIEKYIEEQEKIKEATPIRQQMTTIKANNVNKDIFYTVIKQDECNKYIQLKNRKNKEKIELTDEGIVLTEKLANTLKVKNGDNVAIKENDKEKNVKVIGVTENYLYNYIYMTPNLYNQIFETDVKYNLFIANFEDVNEDEETTLANKLKENDKISGVVFTRNLNKEYQKSLSGLSSIVILFIGCASLLSFMVLINLNNINIEERRRELATFKLLGFYKKELEKYVFRENIILTILGSIFGVFIGMWVLGIIIQSAEVETIMLPVEFNIINVIISILITLCFTLITNFMMKKKIKKIDMIESLKSVE